jgi:hypothetical protein
MADSHVVSGLKAKQEGIKKTISDLKKQVRESQEELRTVSKTLRIFGENPRTGGDKLFRRGELPRIIFDVLREAVRGLDIEEIAGAVMKAEGIDADDPETVATVRQRCTVAMYRYYDKGQIVKERRGAVRVWRLAGFKGPHLLRG